MGKFAKSSHWKKSIAGERGIKINEKKKIVNIRANIIDNFKPVPDMKKRCCTYCASTIPFGKSVCPYCHIQTISEEDMGDGAIVEGYLIHKASDGGLSIVTLPKGIKWNELQEFARERGIRLLEPIT